MIPNKLAYFSHGTTYRTNKEGENISDNSIVFVGDDQSIATRGKIFGVRGVYPGQEEINEEDEGNTSTKIITTSPLFPVDTNGRPLVGTTISVRFRYTNSYKTAGSNMCLNVNGTGAYNIYYNGSDYVSTTSANTTFCGYANREVVYTFRIDVVNGVEHPRWVFVSHGYESGNTNTIGYQLRHNSSTLPASDKFYRYRLLFTSADGKKYVPANTSTSTSATSSKTVNQRPIDPFGEILYYGSTSSVSAGSNPGATVLWEEYTLTLGYSFNRTGAALTMSYPAPVYIKCTPDESDGSAIIDSITPYVQSLPSTDDGKIYIFLGIAYSETSIELMPTHPVYYYDGTGIRLWTGKVLNDKSPLIVTLTPSYNNGTTTYSADKTYSEIVAAYNAGRLIVLNYLGELITSIFYNSYENKVYFSSYSEGYSSIFTVDSSDLWSETDTTIQANWNETNTSSPEYIKNKPTIPAAQVQANWTENSILSLSYIQNKPTIPTAATSAPLMDGTAAIGTSSKYAKEDHVHPSDTSKQDKPIGFLEWSETYFNDWQDFPRDEADARELTSSEAAAIQDIHQNAWNKEWCFEFGRYPMTYSWNGEDANIWTVLMASGDTVGVMSWVLHYNSNNEYWLTKHQSEIATTDIFATVATSGSYNDLTNKPTIPTVGTLNTNNSTAQTVNSSESFSGNISLHKVSKTGSYNDLNDKPTIPPAPTLKTLDGVTLTGSGDISKVVFGKLDNGSFYPGEKTSSGISPNTWTFSRTAATPETRVVYIEVVTGIIYYYNGYEYIEVGKNWILDVTVDRDSGVFTCSHSYEEILNALKSGILVRVNEGYYPNYWPTYDYEDILELESIQFTRVLCSGNSPAIFDVYYYNISPDESISAGDISSSEYQRIIEIIDLT